MLNYENRCDLFINVTQGLKTEFWFPATGFSTQIHSVSLSANWQLSLYRLQQSSGIWEVQLAAGRSTFLRKMVR